MKAQMKQILIPIDIDSVSWVGLLAHTGAGTCRDDHHLWFDVTSIELTKYLLVLGKRDNLEWFTGFYTQFIEVVPDMKGIEIFRFVTPVSEYIGPDNMRDAVVF